MSPSRKAKDSPVQRRLAGLIVHVGEIAAGREVSNRGKVERGRVGIGT